MLSTFHPSRQRHQPDKETPIYNLTQVCLPCSYPSNILICMMTDIKQQRKGNSNVTPNLVHVSFFFQLDRNHSISNTPNRKTVREVSILIYFQIKFRPDLHWDRHRPRPALVRPWLASRRTHPSTLFPHPDSHLSFVAPLPSLLLADSITLSPPASAAASQRRSGLQSALFPPLAGVGGAQAYSQRRRRRCLYHRHMSP